MNLNRDVSITWLGHAAFRLRTPGGKELLIDPFLSDNPSCPGEHKQVDKADLILVTHGHGDHLGGTVPIAQRTGATVVGMPELCYWLGGKGIQKAAPMNKGGSQLVEGIRVTMVHADHSCGIMEDGHVIYAGEPVGFIIQLENGFRIYHAGDTNVFGDMAIIRELHRPNLAFLPIGGHYTMGPREAALAVELLGVSDVAPIHWGTFPILAGTPAELREALDARGLGGVTVHAWSPGDTLRG